jgi:hypothetical protein
MTTARDVIAGWLSDAFSDFNALGGLELNAREARAGAVDLLETLLSAPDSVRLELAAMLLPNHVIDGRPNPYAPPNEDKA